MDKFSKTHSLNFNEFTSEWIVQDVLVETDHNNNIQSRQTQLFPDILS